MKIDMTTREIWNLLKEGSTNQRDFIESLKYHEFKEFIRGHEIFFEEYDLRDLLNGGCLAVEEGGEIDESTTIWENGRITISLY